MIKRIIFLTEVRLSLRDYNRFGIAILQKNGFKVEVWDVTPLLHRKFFQSYVPPDEFLGKGLVRFNNMSELGDAVSRLDDADFIINFISYSFDNLKIHKAISQSKANYGVSYINVHPQPLIEKNGLDLMIEILKKIASYRYLHRWKSLFMKLPWRWLGLKPASLILAGGEKCFNCFNYNFPIDKDTEILQLHALDYDLYLDEKNKPYTNEKPFAVHIDSFFPFHPDILLVGEKSPINDPEKYYRSLNNFFDLIEKESGLEVVIAAHPRSYYEKLPPYYKHRKCIRGKTAALIKECSLVMTQHSTAVNMAVLFYKPVIFITSSDFERTWELHYLEEMAKCFGKKPIFIDRDKTLDLKKELIVVRELYDKYRVSYIKARNSEELPFWQIVANRLKTGKR